MDVVTLQPAAGAQGEFAGAADVPRVSREARRRRAATQMLVPDSAHGTNPAIGGACAAIEVDDRQERRRRQRRPRALKAALDDRDVAGFMLTNPNTLGLFEEQLGEIARRRARRGRPRLLDGANMNALLGVVRPGDLGLRRACTSTSTRRSPRRTARGGPGAGRRA